MKTKQRAQHLLGVSHFLFFVSPTAHKKQKMPATKQLPIWFTQKIDL